MKPDIRLATLQRWASSSSGLRNALTKARSILVRRGLAGPPAPIPFRGTRTMDMTWITGRIAIGGGIWRPDNMALVAEAGITHIIDMQIEFDDTSLAEPFAIEVLWNPTDDDFQPKPPELFQRAVDFALHALDQPETKLYVHCAAGVHRAPMMTLAILCSLSWTMEQAMDLIEAKRPVVDFADVYVDSVERFLQQQLSSKRSPIIQ